MSKKVIFGTINAESLSKLSDFHVAMINIDATNKEYKDKKDAVNEKLNTMLENRQNDLDAGIPTDEVVRKWDVAPLNKELRKLAEEQKKALEPYKTAYKEAMSLLPDSLYEGYEQAMSNGNMSKLTSAIHPFLIEIGCITTESTTSKFAQVMSIRCSGARKASGKSKAAGNFISNKKENQFKEIFMLAFLQYVIVDKGVVTINEDNTLSMTVYED